MIRPYKISDKHRLIEIFNLNVPTYFDAKEIEDFIRYLDEKSDHYLTVEQEEKIVGGVGHDFIESDQSGRVTWIFFDPEYTGKGLGHEAVEHCNNIFKSNSQVEKLVVRTSQLAYKFFEKFDYKTIKIEKEYWGPGLDLYIMERPI